MRNKRNRVIIIILAVLFLILSSGETLFLYMGLPLINGIENAESEIADFSFMTENEGFNTEKIKGINIDTQNDFDYTKDETAIKSEIATVLYDTTAFECNTVIITNTDYGTKTFDVIEYIITSAQGLDMSVGFAVDGMKNGKVNTADIEKLYNKYCPDFFVIEDYDSFGKDENEIASNLADINENINGLSETVKVGFNLDYDTDFALLTPLMNREQVDFIIYDLTVPSTVAGFENKIKLLADIRIKYDISVNVLIHNEKTMTGGDWNDAAEMLSELRLSFYNGVGGMVVNSSKCVVDDYKGTTVSIYSFFKSYNDVDYTALDITSFDIENNVLTIKGKAKQDYPVFVNNDLTGEWQKKTVDKSLAYSFDIKLDYGVNNVTIIHKNATYTYRIDVAEDLIRNVSYSNEKKTVHIECNSLADSTVYCYLFGEYVQMENCGEAGNGLVKYCCDYKTLLPKTVDEGDISIGVVHGGMFQTVINGEKENTPYTDNGFGRCDSIIVTNDYSESTPASENSDLSVPSYSYQLSGETGEASKIAVYENTVLYKMKNGIQLSSANAVYVVNGYKMPENNCNAQLVKGESETSVSFVFDYLPFTRVVLAPQNYYVGYLQREYNVNSCEAEYVDIVIADTVNVNGEFDLSDNDLFSKYEWLKSADGQIILRLYLKNKGCFYGYSMVKENNNTIKFTFCHKKNLNDNTVIIDAGHGGSGDVGTYSFDGKIYEKKVTLSVALKVQSILQNQGINVVLSRTADYNLSIYSRQIITRYYNPDAFVSIHCDGSADSTAYGTHTFYYYSYSKALADNIHKYMVKAYNSGCYTDSTKTQYNGCNLGTKFFPYGVTRITECPSVLVECGYLTNKEDELFLTTENGQNLIASAIAQGIIDTLK